MLRRMALCLTVAAFAAIFASEAPQAQTEAEAAIRYHFPAYEEDIAVSIAACESGLGADIYNEASGAYGIFQFLPSTSYALGFDHSAMADPWYAAWAASRYQDIAGWSPWACAY